MQIPQVLGYIPLHQISPTHAHMNACNTDIICTDYVTDKWDP